MVVSVIIVSFNTADVTKKCIFYADRALEDVDSEIILIDNASTDDTLIKIKSLKTSKKLIIIKNESNLGFAKAVNLGIKKSQGDYKLLLNSDAHLAPGDIKDLLAFAKGKEDIGAVAPKLVNKDGSAQGSIFRFPTLARAVRQYWLGENGILDKYSFEDTSKVEAVSMAVFLITPAAIKSVGFLDDNYFMYYEDLDYCKRLKKAGLKVYYLPKVEVLHYHGESGKNLESSDTQWRRLIPSSKIYHGVVMHYLINFVIWSGQKLKRI